MFGTILFLQLKIVWAKSISEKFYRMVKFEMAFWNRLVDLFYWKLHFSFHFLWQTQSQVFFFCLFFFEWDQQPDRRYFSLISLIPLVSGLVHIFECSRNFHFNLRLSQTISTRRKDFVSTILRDYATIPNVLSPILKIRANSLPVRSFATLHRITRKYSVQHMTCRLTWSKSYCKCL